MGVEETPFPAKSQGRVFDVYRVSFRGFQSANPHTLGAWRGPRAGPTVALCATRGHTGVEVRPEARSHTLAIRSDNQAVGKESQGPVGIRGTAHACVFCNLDIDVLEIFRGCFAVQALTLAEKSERDEFRLVQFVVFSISLQKMRKRLSEHSLFRQRIPRQLS